ncbi:hypothetical protein BOX15_Mlig033822g1 [Macrostomum lignano]|uniref:Uncharacterized protein n=2 Tax=Macrostomum lignano TaxID=282301 RepID=A0A267EWT8_9PLAT|nr:hypothetical protein BOX15_Mlig033822g1 [Macrostomum lignano]
MTLSDGHNASINALALTDDGRQLASGCDEGVICLWDSELRRLRARLRCPPGLTDIGGAASSVGAVSALAFADAWQPGRLYAAQGSHLVAWDTRAIRPREPLFVVPAGQPAATQAGGSDEVNGLALLTSPTSAAAGERRLATADDGGWIRVFDGETGELIRSLRKHDSIASAVLFRPGKDWQLISGGMDCRLVVTDWKGCRGHALNIFDIDEILDAELCSDAAAAGQVQASQPLIHCLAATPDGLYAAAGLENGSVELFSAGGRHLQHAESLYGHTAAVSALLCLPGHLLLSGGNDCDCFLWNLDSDWSGGSFAHSDKVNALCGVAPDRVYLADSGPAVHCCDLNVAQLAAQQPQAPQLPPLHHYHRVVGGGGGGGVVAVAEASIQGGAPEDVEDTDEEEDDREDEEQDDVGSGLRI